MRAEVEAIVGPGSVLERPVQDLWPLGLMRRRSGEAAPPVLVARPATYEQVATLLAWASGANVGVVPVGGGSGVCGAVEAAAGELAIDLTGLDRVLEVNEDDLTCRVQAGAVGLRVEEALNRRRLTLGHHPSSLPFSTIGGLISTRSSGQESSRYGNIEDMLLALTVALPDGTLAALRPGPRSAIGPALHQLYVGAEGTLGVVLEAELRLHRLPARVIGGGHRTDSVEQGLEAMREVVQSEVRPLVMRLYDPEDTAFQGLGLEGCLLVLAVAGEPDLAEAEASVALRALSRAGAAGLGEEPWRHWRDHRLDLSAERLREFLSVPGSYLDTIEVAAPWSRLPGLYAEVKAGLTEAAGFALCHFSHAYPHGCCAYFTFAGHADSEAAATAAYRRAWAAAMAACPRHGATIGHHHGVGQVRRAWMQAEMGGWAGLWRAIRAGVDPAGVMNPRGVGGP
ncbi:MAG: FAD-binding oxidoreductase [Candidatus Dormibacteraceae bacterium]